MRSLYHSGGDDCTLGGVSHPHGFHGPFLLLALARLVFLVAGDIPSDGQLRYRKNSATLLFSLTNL